jgi:hypothetical protein
MIIYEEHTNLVTQTKQRTLTCSYSILNGCRNMVKCFNKISGKLPINVTILWFKGFHELTAEIIQLLVKRNVNIKTVEIEKCENLDYDFSRCELQDIQRAMQDSGRKVDILVEGENLWY